VAREQERLRKEVAKLDSDLARFDAKLANEKFLEKAPAEVVADHRDRRAQTAEARDKLAAALARLGG
jgi:valyl-tRNA synthetase